MLHYRTVLPTGLLMIVASISMAQEPSAIHFTDQELKQAGWSEQQIAELRASAPAPEAAKKMVGDLPPAKVPISYSSVFDNYVPFDFVPDIEWQDANDKVGEIGGWRAYLKIVQEANQREAENAEGDSQ